VRLYDEKTHEPVTIPHRCETFRGEAALVEAIDQEPSPGRSGKLLVRFDPNAALRTVYPGVVGLYFADEPRAS
jgi:hypothetical protein